MKKLRYIVKMGEELESVHSVLEKYLPPDELDRVNRILLGNKLKYVRINSVTAIQ